MMAMLGALHTAADVVLKRIRRSPLYYERYNNTTYYSVNRAYRQYARECALRYAKTTKTTFTPSLLLSDAALRIREAIRKEKAQALSTKMSELIERKDENVIHLSTETKLIATIRNPLDMLGLSILDVFRSPATHQALLTFFQGNYGIANIIAWRSFQSPEQFASSWLWHSDSQPCHTCKLFLHLTPVDADKGATEFMSFDDTMAYRRAGYFGQMADERRSDLDVFAREHGLPYRPFHLDADPGDATIFNMNCFHRAKAPCSGFRDVIQFFLLPSPVPWDEHFAQHADVLRGPMDGFPKDPRMKTTATAGSM